jgi:hypothetical protein
LFCVLTPGVALALGEAASCLLHPPAAHVHTGDQADAAAHQHHEVQAGHHGHAMPEPAKLQHDGKGSAGPCCAMLCVSAIAADPPIVATPSPPISLCVSEISQRLPGKAPPQLFRPPIS